MESGRRHGKLQSRPESGEVKGATVAPPSSAARCRRYDLLAVTELGGEIFA
jgi:hypothetical protein